MSHFNELSAFADCGKKSETRKSVLLFSMGKRERLTDLGRIVFTLIALRVAWEMLLPLLPVRNENYLST